jgi:hypothetical protein
MGDGSTPHPPTSVVYFSKSGLRRSHSIFLFRGPILLCESNNPVSIVATGDTPREPSRMLYCHIPPVSILVVGRGDLRDRVDGPLRAGGMVFLYDLRAHRCHPPVRFLALSPFNMMKPLMHP